MNLGLFNLAGAKAAGTNLHAFYGSGALHAHALKVWKGDLPGLVVRMRGVTAYEKPFFTNGTGARH